jgi:hypothetical protein
VGGNPAKILKQYNGETKEWERAKKKIIGNTASI